MKTIGLTVLMLLGVVSFARAQSQADISAELVINGRYLSFNNKVACDTRDKKSSARCLPRQQQKQEIVKWKNAIQKAANMLPREFFKKTGTISWGFFVNRNYWATAYAGLTIDINLLSNYENPPQWMTWEPFRKNGLTETERVFIALHEMGHLSGGFLDLLYVYQFQGIAWWNNDRFEAISSIHCSESDFFSEDIKVFEGYIYYKGMSFVVGDKKKYCRVYDAFDKNFAKKIPLENETTLYGKEMGSVEDLAESFALYIMWPEYLKKNFPEHYTAINKTLMREYPTRDCMPESIITRLSVPFDTKRCEQ